jgi:DNA helicase-2/ATP-dependent DNA helicase PcrA
VFENNIQLKDHYLNLDDKSKRNFIYEVLDHISLKKKSLIEAIQDSNEPFEYIYWEYQELLKQQNAIDFDDVIFLAYRIFSNRFSINKFYRRLYKYISIDEAQDLNFAQYEFIKLLCGDEHKNVLMVGDLNQSLFHFNGSDIKYMNSLFITDFGAKVIKLNTNYRSSKAVLEIANKIKENSVSIDENTPSGIFEIKEFNNVEDESIWVADKIEEFLNKKRYDDVEGDITLDNIAILARNKYLFQGVEKELNIRKAEGKKLDYFYKKGSDVTDFGSELIILFDLGLSILTNSYDLLHYTKIQKIIGIEQIQLLDNGNGISNLKRIGHYIKEGIGKEYYEILINAWELIEKNINNVPSSLENIENSVVKKYRNLTEEALNELDKILFDIKSFCELWKTYSRNTKVELKSLQHFKTQIALGITNINNNQNGITLGTVHSVKGLEYTIVFVIGLTEGAFPDFRAVQKGGNEFKSEENGFYVAVTRAERFLFLTYPKNRMTQYGNKVQKVSSFIKKIQDGI